MRAIDVMVRDVVTVSPETDVREAVKLLAEHNVSAFESSIERPIWLAHLARRT